MLGIIYDEDENSIGLNNLFANRVMNYYLIKGLIKSDVNLLGEVSLVLNSDRSFLSKESQISKVWENEIMNSPQLFFKNKLRVVRILKSNMINPLRLSIVHQMIAANILRYGSMRDQRLVELLSSRKKFSFIDRIKLPHDYFANVYLYNIPEIKTDDLAIKIEHF